MQAKAFLPIRFVKSVGKRLLREFWMAKLNPCWDYSRCYVVVIHQNRMPNEGNLIGMQYKPSICWVNVIRGETSSGFCQDACRQSGVCISTHSASLTGRSSVEAKSFDLKTGLNSVSAQKTPGNVCRREANQCCAGSLLSSSSMKCLKNSQRPNPQPFIERMELFSFHWGLKQGYSLDHEMKHAQYETQIWRLNHS